jgi:large subunit ribosomal protein L13
VAAPAQRTTQSLRPEDVVQRWHVIDAEGQVLGRLAARIASVLRGKHRRDFTPHVDHGEGVIVVNAEKVKLTGRKLDHKLYHRHSGYMGSIRTVTAGELLASAHPERVVQSAVRGMLPKNSLGRRLVRRLKVYAGPRHPHAAQKPQELTVG